MLIKRKTKTAQCCIIWQMEHLHISYLSINKHLKCYKRSMTMFYALLFLALDQNHRCWNFLLAPTFRFISQVLHISLIIISFAFIFIVIYFLIGFTFPWDWSSFFNNSWTLIYVDHDAKLEVIEVEQTLYPNQSLKGLVMTKSFNFEDPLDFNLKFWENSFFLMLDPSEIFMMKNKDVVLHVVKKEN